MYRRELFREVLVEAEAAHGGAALLGGVAEELGGPAAPLAAPHLGGLDDAGGLEGAAEAGLVQPAAEEKLVELLELAERERRRQEAERHRGLADARAHVGRRGVDHGALAGRDRREVGQRVELESALVAFELRKNLPVL